MTASQASCDGSWRTAYYFYSEDYVKLKVLGFVVHKDTLEAVD